MQKTIAAGLLALALGLTGAVGSAVSQDVQPAVKSGPPSVDWPIGDLLADAGAKAVLTKDIPQVVAYDGLDQIKGLSIRSIAKFPQAEIDDAKLAAIQADLAALTPAAK
jgi:hypothetical protein